MKDLIVYYSMSGNTKFAAEQIARQLGADVLPLEPEKPYPMKGLRKFLVGGRSALAEQAPPLRPYDTDPSQYDRIILGMPVWAGMVPPPLRTFLNENRERLAGKRFAAFACSGGGNAQKALDALRRLAGCEAWEAEASFIDPKDKPGREKEEAIRVFCRALTEE
jgi:flavodoxin